MKIKLKIEAFGFPPGTTLNVADDVGKRYIDSGDATLVKEPVKKSSKPTIENKAMSAS